MFPGIPAVAAMLEKKKRGRPLKVRPPPPPPPTPIATPPPLLSPPHKAAITPTTTQIGESLSPTKSMTSNDFIPVLSEEEEGSKSPPTPVELKKQDRMVIHPHRILNKAEAAELLREKMDELITNGTTPIQETHKPSGEYTRRVIIYNIA